jgi:hypothetical protein
MSFRPRLPVALVASAAFFFSGAAWGQTLSIKNNNEGVVRGDSYNSTFLRLNQFNQANCVANEIVRFNVAITNVSGVAVSGYHLEAWIGTACDQQANRPGSSFGCRKIGEAAANVRQLDIWVRDLVGGLNPNEWGDTTSSGGGTSGTGGTDVGGTGGTGGTTAGAGGTLLSGGAGGTIGTGGSSGTGGDLGLGATGGTLATGGTGTGGTDMLPMAETAGAAATDSSGSSNLDGPESVEGEAPISVCDPDASSSTPNDRTMYVMLVNADNANLPSIVKWAFKYDLAGPPAPVSVKAGVGEDALVLTWTQADNSPIDLLQYVMLCDPPPHADVTGAAGDTGDAPPAESTCQTSAFLPGQVPSVQTIADHMCGQIQNTGTTGQAGPLVNGVKYAVAIAARDGYYNVGPVSDIVCGTPEPVTDFFEAYKAAGGRGGGGFCSIGHVRTHALSALFLAGALGLVVRRRTRARRRSRS